MDRADFSSRAKRARFDRESEQKAGKRKRDGKEDDSEDVGDEESR
jgi:hypothetical protein